MKTRFKTYRSAYHIIQHPASMGSVPGSKGFTGPQVGISGEYTVMLRASPLQNRESCSPAGRSHWNSLTLQFRTAPGCPWMQDTLENWPLWRPHASSWYRAKRDLAQMIFPAHIRSVVGGGSCWSQKTACWAGHPLYTKA